ncbi:HNH endonuclease [Streptomyces sp. NPDC101455]|uniref:HNH endonuclease n=1 Tax=Streptomyces sp. NPDC101455 TaxID=3366142 RepID=UPI003826A1A8
MSRLRPVNSAKRRVRKEQLARRHGQRCAYCARPFGDLREATLDHIVPQSLWRSWSATSLMLACADCNHAKADRLPLSLALVLLVWADPTAPTVCPVDWPVLARLAHANQSAYTASWSPDPIAERSTADLRDEPRHTRRHRVASGVRPVCRAAVRRPSIRPDCLRAARPVRVCVGPTGEAVFA